MAELFHFIYRTSSTSGKYYIGRHSTKRVNDNYFGSGKWVRSIKDKSQLKREILRFCDNVKELKMLEEQYLKENINDPNCMNFNNSSVGFASGEYSNWHALEERAIDARRKRGNKGFPTGKGGRFLSHRLIKNKCTGEKQ